jgi:hypothetical protein
VSPAADRPDAASGGFAEESARLIGAFREWAAKSAEATNAPAGQGDSSSEPSHAPECDYCPICQGAALLRGVKPEVAEHLADAFSALAAAVVALFPKDAAPAERRRPEPAQHIDVSGDDRADSVG